MVCDPVVTDRNSSSLAWPRHSIVRLPYEYAESLYKCGDPVCKPACGRERKNN